MSPIETMALIVALLAAVKILIIIHNPKTWMKVVRKIYSSPAITTILGLAIAIVSLHYLLKYMSIVHVFAAMLFFMGLMLIGFAAYSRDTLLFANKILQNKNAIKKAWLSILIWVALIIWVLYILF